MPSPFCQATLEPFPVHMTFFLLEPLITAENNSSWKSSNNKDKTETLTSDLSDSQELTRLENILSKIVHIKTINLN